MSTMTLEDEARVLSRYLLGREAPEFLRERYAAGVRVRLGSDTAMSGPAGRLALRRPWMLGMLDAACAVRDPGGELRRRLLVMAAVVEADPAGAGAFVPRAEPWWRWAVIVAWNGLVAGALLAGGLVVLAAIGGRPVDRGATA
jgi:hypothetical protein